ncbi:MAG: AAA family ATPase [Patescibacteria group bacterium]
MLFVILQVSHFLKHKSFIREDHLWTSIYRLYNNMSMEGVSRFDPKVFEEQYNTLVKKVIWPLSLEHIREKGGVGKPHNILLYGLYGAGKSQLLTHVLAERKYTLPNGKDITLNANVLNIGVSEFADMLVKSVSGFRKRLSDIHENTGLPIILIVEDIDTIIKEVGTESDPVSQALTTFFEGVGSLPVTVITSTNCPERLPERHLRPNRLDVLSAFNYPIEEGVLKGVLHTHWTRANLEKTWNARVSFDAFSEHVLPKIENFTASHVAAFIKTLIEELEFEDQTSLDKSSIFAIVDRSLEMVIVPIGDMTERQESMQRWYANLTSRNSKKIGF